MKKVLSQADSGKDSHHRMKRIAQKKHRRNQNLKRIWISLLILASYGAWQSNLSISSACAIQSQFRYSVFQGNPRRSILFSDARFLFGCGNKRGLSAFPICTFGIWRGSAPAYRHILGRLHSCRRGILHPASASLPLHARSVRSCL